LGNAAAGRMAGGGHILLKTILYVLARMWFWFKAGLCLCAALAVYVYIFRLYHGSVEKLKIHPKPANPAETAVVAARSLKGILYDQSKGRYNNLAGRLGMIVCIDVPRLAYARAGMDLDALLRRDYAVPREYSRKESAGNTPDTPFFFRRVRNLRSYCRANGKMLLEGAEPRPGDLVFFGIMHVAMVTEVDGKGYFRLIENSPDTLWTVEHGWETWANNSMCRLLEPLPSNPVGDHP